MILLLELQFFTATHSGKSQSANGDKQHSSKCRRIVSFSSGNSSDAEVDFPKGNCLSAMQSVLLAVLVR